MSHAADIVTDLGRAVAAATAYQDAYREYVACVTSFRWEDADAARTRAVHAFDGHLDELAAAGKRLEHFAGRGE